MAMDGVTFCAPLRRCPLNRRRQPLFALWCSAFSFRVEFALPLADRCVLHFPGMRAMLHLCEALHTHEFPVHAPALLNV